jgi:hypothetical protein
MSTVDFTALRERSEMWVNFFRSCDLGTVVKDCCSTVWQKRGTDTWQRVGHEGDYQSRDIQWPAEVLRRGAD